MHTVILAQTVCHKLPLSLLLLLRLQAALLPVVLMGLAKFGTGQTFQPERVKTPEQADIIVQ